MSSTNPVGSPTTPTADSEASSSFSPYRHRLNGLTRRQMLERKLRQSPHSKHTGRSPTATPTEASNTKDEPPQAPTLSHLDVSSGHVPPVSLVQRRAQLFGGTTEDKPTAHSSKKLNGVNSSANGGPITPVSDHEDERKSYFSGGGTTVTTATSSTAQPPLNGYSALSDDRSDLSSQKNSAKNDSGDLHHSRESSDDTIPRQPLHLQAKRPDSLSHPDASTTEVRYFRIVYKGVVPLVSHPDPSSDKSGAYLSYGEVVSTKCEFDIDDESVRQPSQDSAGREKRTIGDPRSPGGVVTGNKANLPPFSPPRSVSSQNSCSVSSLDTLRTSSTAPTNTATPPPQQEDPAKKTPLVRHVIRVDEIVTGGYAVDATDNEQTKQKAMQTPKRSNTNNISSSEQPAIPMVDGPCRNDSFHYGFLFTNKKNVTIAEPISEPPVCHSGHYLYKITSSSPLPILTGPCVDAPRTRAMVLPGTIHDVCLRVIPGDDDVAFLRLSHRRGWIADRRISNVGGKSKLRSIPVVKEVSGETGQGMSCDASTSSLSNTSLASSSVTAPGSVARRRHRPPRRRRDKGGQQKNSNSPRPPGTATPESVTAASRARSSERTPTTDSRNGASGQDKIASPTSNVSLLSDGSSVGYEGLSPGAHSHGSTTQQPGSVSPSLFLMRVNAPRGLKILDAPHFQVSSLIHGQQGSVKTPTTSPKSRGRPDVGGQSLSKPTNSIFHTMGGSHTTPSSRVSGNPAVFDGKTRTLPRGALFEASTRMEVTGSSYGQGAGLIKLSDGSGWAIVPRQSELDHQYKNYHGGVTSIREGEATRAFEEVGNAVVEETDGRRDPNSAAPTVWLRIATRNGVLVSCPPPVPAAKSDEDTSPTSSTEGGSSVVSGGGSNYGGMTSQDSDIASSVGSAFLDAVFRTPKRKETETHSETPRGFDKIKRGNEQKAPPNTVPCGMCVEVDNWDTQPGISQDYARLVGGQGWIPRQLGGRPCTVPVDCPDVRFGSFWFRVQPSGGIKVRGGPSRRAPSIKSDDGMYFRFECGEFLRACEVMTIFDTSSGTETFAKLYRNRHVQFLKMGHEHHEHRLLASLTAQAEWVQVHSKDTLFLEECGSAPRIQRHQQGWRYNAVHDSGIQVRKGPSFSAEPSGEVLLGGESVLINERVTPPGERITWLRLRDGQGWVHDVGVNGEVMMIAHSLHDRAPARLAKRPVKPQRPPHHDEAAYNTIIARLFHGDADEPAQGVRKTYNV